MMSDSNRYKTFISCYKEDMMFLAGFVTVLVVLIAVFS